MISDIITTEIVKHDLFSTCLTNQCCGVVNMYDKNDIKTMIDGMSISGVLDILSQVCYEKAEDLRTDWQDPDTARAWEKVGRAVGKIRIKADLY